MLHAGLDLSRRRVDYCLLGEGGERVEVEPGWVPRRPGFVGSFFQEIRISDGTAQRRGRPLMVGLSPASGAA
jgi:hypothetical protein